MLNPEGWLRVSVVHHSIRYNPEGLPAFELAAHEWWDAGYAALVLSPFFLVSPGGRFAAFRVLLAVSAAVSFFVFRYAFVSVWCFFAAALALYLCWAIPRAGWKMDAVSQTP